MIAVNRPQSTINRLLLTLFGIAILIGAGKVTWTEFQSYLSLRSSQQWGQRPATFTKILKDADDSMIGAEFTYSFDGTLRTGDQLYLRGLTPPAQLKSITLGDQTTCYVSSQGEAVWTPQFTDLTASALYVMIPILILFPFFIIILSLLHQNFSGSLGCHHRGCSLFFLAYGLFLT